MILKNIVISIFATSLLFGGGQEIKPHGMQGPKGEDPDPGGTGGSGGHGTVSPLPAYSIVTSPSYPWGPWASPGDVLLENQSLGVNESLVSQNGAYRVTLQGDGNLVIYRGNTWQGVWDSTTAGYWIGPSGRLTMQADGNLVIYNSNNVGYWDIGRNNHFQPAIGSYGYYLKIQDDGNLCVYTRWGIDPRWFQAVYGVGLGTWDRFYSHGNRHYY